MDPLLGSEARPLQLPESDQEPDDRQDLALDADLALGEKDKPTKIHNT